MNFGDAIWKYYYHIWNTQIYLVPKFGENIKILKFGTQNALFGYFWARILRNYSHIWNQHPRICLTGKFWEEIKMP